MSQTDDPRTDEALMLAYRDGDADAFEILYARYRARLFRYLLHQCQRRELADDLFQGVWMSVIQARTNYEVSAKFSTWLFRIAHNRMIDSFRASNRANQFEIMDTDQEALQEIAGSAELDPARIAQRADSAKIIDAAVASLPLPQREVFLLSVEGDLTIEEIGTATGVGFETAKSRLRYAYAKLRQTLQDLR